MVLTRTQKQALAAVYNPLRDVGILKRVFRFLPGNYLFLGNVCREWKSVYEGIGNQQALRVTIGRANKFVTCGNKHTLCSAAVSSPTTVRWASSCGLPAIHTSCKLQKIAGTFADARTLAILRELGMPLSALLVNTAAASGRMSILQLLLSDQHCPRPSNLSHWAAHSGSIPLLNWLRTQSWCIFDHDTCAGAAKGGHLATLQHLRNEGCEWREQRIACYAASGGSIEVLEWLRQQQGIAVDTSTLSWAACAEQIGMCKHLRSLGCEWDASVCTSVATFGATDALRWLQDHGCPWDVSAVCCGAAFAGCTDILDYVLEQGEVLSAAVLTKALNCAGAYRQLQAAQWFREHGAEWPAVLTYNEGSNFGLWGGDTLAWARAKGCTSPVLLSL
eukprot:2507-Heterococcus_DN1.PRE.7